MPEIAIGSTMLRSPGQLGRGFAISGPRQGVLYLRPLGLLSGVEAERACADGSALPLAGGPLAFALCEPILRRPDGIAAEVMSLAALRDWAERQGSEVARHVALALEALSAPRPPFAGLALDRPRLMGIVNATPDSFSEQGAHFGSEAAIAHGRALAAEGADILDVGGESTRPGAAPVAPAEERRRIEPVLAGLGDCGVVLSIDTRHALVMAAALDAGAAIVNDVSALAGEAASLPLAAARGPAVVLMHMQGEPATMNRAPRYDCAPLDIYDALAERVAACIAAGIPRERIAVDPGLGFGKRTAHNLAILARLSLFHGLGCAVMIGASRKLLAGASRREVAPQARLGASLAAALAALGQGAQLLRVHDVAATRQAVELWRALNGAAA